MLPLKRPKPLVTLLTVGDDDDLRLLVTAGLTNFCAELGRAYHLDVEQMRQREPNPQESRNIQNFEYESDSLLYSHNLPMTQGALALSLLSNEGVFSGALWVVNPKSSPSKEERGILRLAKHFGVREVLILIARVPGVDEPYLDELEALLREALVEAGFSGDEAFLLRGVADARDTAKALLQAFEERLVPTPFAEEGSFFMPIEDVVHLARRGNVVITGRIAQGRIKEGDKLEILGLRAPISTVAIALERFRGQFKQGEYAEAGHNIGILLGVKERGLIERGQVAATPGTLFVGDLVETEIYCYTKAQGGPDLSWRTGDSFDIALHTWRGDVLVKEGGLYPGESGAATLRLRAKIALKVGFRFGVICDGQSAGVGVIKKVLG